MPIPFTPVRNDDAFATVTLRRGERTITLVAVMHVGPKPYWQATQAELDALEAGGAVIHSEGVGGQKQTTFRGWVRSGLMYGAVGAVSRSLRLICGWRAQKKALTYPKTWETHDLPVTTALDRVSTPALLRTFVLTQLFSPLAAVFIRTGRMSLHDVNDSDASLDIIDARNRHAIDEALAADRDVALIWGAAHIPGMVDLLEQVGFTIADVAWRQFWPDGAQKRAGTLAAA